MFNYPMTEPTIPPNDASVNVEMTNIGIHPEQVFHWRKEQFGKMGFVETQVLYLASHRVDIHQMRSLLDSGCPHELALRIMADTTVFGEDELDYAHMAHAAIDDSD